MKPESLIVGFVIGVIGGPIVAPMGFFGGILLFIVGAIVINTMEANK